MSSALAWLVLHPAELVGLCLLIGFLLTMAIGWWRWHG